MRRIWIGVAFLAGLLVAGVVVMQVTDRQMGQISSTLEQAAEAPVWAEAVALGEKAQKDWQAKWKLMAALTDHGDMDTIDLMFAQRKVCQQYQDEAAHAALCAQLARAMESLKENHRLTWWNLL